MKRNKIVTASAVLLAGLVLVLCKPHVPSCKDHFADGDTPVLLNAKLANQTTALCFEGYAAMYSGISHTPLWSAEHLTAPHLEQARELKRHNAFHAEEQVPPGERAELRDYTHSGFDRGHMSPSGDMPTEKAQYESFSLANMIPQNANNNEILWEGVEESTRNLVRQRSELYTVTGPIFDGASIQRLNNRIFIPSAVFKAVYDPVRHEAAAYVTPNAPGMEYQTVTIAELEKRVNINLFPHMPASIKETKMSLPAPKPHGYRQRDREARGTDTHPREKR
jgi:endonuclease G, mitochondrial